MTRPIIALAVAALGVAGCGGSEASKQHGAAAAASVPARSAGSSIGSHARSLVCARVNDRVRILADDVQSINPSDNATFAPVIADASAVKTVLRQLRSYASVDQRVRLVQGINGMTSLRQSLENAVSNNFTGAGDQLGAATQAFTPLTHTISDICPA